MSETDKRLLLLAPQDNVVVAVEFLPEGQDLLIDGEPTRTDAPLSLGHKVARHLIPSGATITKYGAPIGVATSDIAKGAHVHVHNVASNYTRTHIIE